MTTPSISVLLNSTIFFILSLSLFNMIFNFSKLLMVLVNALLVCVGFSVIFKKLKDLMPVLADCFQDFVSFARAMPVLDAQSFDCMLGILQCTDITAKFFIYGTNKGKSEYQPHGVPDVTEWDENLSSLLMKKVLQVFPLNPTCHMSEKVWLTSILSFQIIFFAPNESVVFFFPLFIGFDWISFLLCVFLIIFAYLLWPMFYKLLCACLRCCCLNLNCCGFLFFCLTGWW